MGSVFDIAYWECPECGQPLYNCTEENIKKHVCMSKKSDEEIDAILRKCLEEYKPHRESNNRQERDN